MQLRKISVITLIMIVSIVMLLSGSAVYAANSSASTYQGSEYKIGANANYGTKASTKKDNYSKYCRKWLRQGDPAYSFDITKCSSKSVTGTISMGGYFDGHPFNDEVTVTKPIKNGASHFTVKTKKHKKITVWVKFGKIHKECGTLFGIKMKFKSKDKHWNSFNRYETPFGN